MPDDKRSLAPFIIFGGILAIGISTVSVVLVSHCQRDAAYDDAVRIRPGEERPAAPPPDPRDAGTDPAEP